MAKSEKDEKPAITAIENVIYTIRGQQVMLDKDLAKLYGVETKRINEAVKRNSERFPEDFMFQLSYEDNVSLRNQITDVDCEVIETKQDTNLRSQFATSSSQMAEKLIFTKTLPDLQRNWGGSRYKTFAFTENGIAMLSSVLRSPQAIQVNIMIMRAFVAIRKAVANGSLVVNPTASRMENVESGLLAVQSHIALHDKQFDEVFKRLEEKEAAPTQGVYYDGQIFDAYTFVCERIKEAEHEIILIDNYVDETVLRLLDKRSPGVAATIYTQNKFASVQQDVAKHNAQYPAITLRRTDNVHDRFLIIDDTVYHIGASIKDLGRKLFAFSQLESFSPALLLARL